MLNSSDLAYWQKLKRGREWSLKKLTYKLTEDGSINWRTKTKMKEELMVSEEQKCSYLVLDDIASLLHALLQIALLKLNKLNKENRHGFLNSFYTVTFEKLKFLFLNFIAGNCSCSGSKCLVRHFEMTAYNVWFGLKPIDCQYNAGIRFS